MFALVDCNNFYASCERVFQPALRNKPVVVLSNNDGCVIARSNEAKKLGIPMGAPAFEFKKIFEEKDIAVFSSNYALYDDMSARVMQLLTSFAPEIEVYSIDESFLKFENCVHLDIYAYGHKIREAVTQGTGIPISLGFAPTKALAKVANRVAKKFPERTNGVYVIDNEQKRIKALKWVKVEDIWGIGRKHAKRLNLIGVKNAYQFTQLEDDWVRSKMSVVGLRLKKDLEGIAVLDLEQPQDKKNIATTRSFNKNYTNYEEIKERVSTFAVSCAEKLRAQNSCCNALVVFIHTNPHRKELGQYSKNIKIKLPFATNSSIDISKYATLGLKFIFKSGYAYKKAGVIVMDLVPEDQKQICLFENTNENHHKLMSAMDKLNKKIGQSKVKLGSQDPSRTWKMRQEHLSPRYTTNIKEIITVR